MDAHGQRVDGGEAASDTVGGRGRAARLLIAAESEHRAALDRHIALDDELGRRAGVEVGPVVDQRFPNTTTLGSEMVHVPAIVSDTYDPGATPPLEQVVGG